MSVTKAPSGLSIARNKLTFTFSWKIADRDYSAGHELQYRTNLTGTGKWNDITIARSATKKTITLDGSEFYPTTEKRLKHITFRVRGKRNPYTETHSNETTTYTPDWSAWVSKTMTFLTPERPDLEAELDSQNANKTTFTWDAEVDLKGSRPFTNVQWQSILKKDCKSTDASKFKWTNSNSGWQAGTGTAEDSVSITENSVSLANGSWTRWFRVRSRGPRGYSDWRYAKHVYAKPYKAIISSTKATVANNATTVVVNWTVASNAAHPIDSTVVEYLIDTPGENLSVPAGDVNWQPGATLSDTTDKDKVKFTIGSVLNIDQCLWVRIVTKHDVDANDTYSSPKLVSCGKLTAPTNLSVTGIDDTTYRATVSATNGSSVPDSRIAVCFTKKGWDKPIVVGILDHGDSSITVQCPTWTSQTDISFSVYAFQGSTSRVTKDGYYKYAVTANMKSATVKDGGDVPTAPATLSAEISDTPGEVILTWAWSWNKADSAEISWSQNPNAWESTDQPSTYTITNVNAAKWRVSGLETGVKWYFRVRLAVEADGALSYGPYSDNAEVDLSSAPAAPVLVLSAAVAAKDSMITASWGYVSTDSTGQAYAEICKATLNNGVITYGDVIARAKTEQHVDITLGDGWVTGSTYNLSVRVTSASGHVSEWSDLVPIQIADPLICTITSTSLSTETIPVSDDNPEAYDINVLTAMPLTATITGAGTGGVTTLIIERAEEYHMIRPDDSQTDGYEGETIALIRQDGESQITVSNADLIGALDDGAPYRLIAVIEDGLGQSDSQTIDFMAQWEHQAGIPGGSVQNIGLVTKITPTAPTWAETGDVCDIYRISADKPELIIQNGEFGTVYVDPYPAIGEGKGHRIVCRTANGDYITATNQPAWTDLIEQAVIDEYGIIVDFDGRQLILPYNIALANKWTKDFQLTTYLGGSQQGDWNPGITRTATYNVLLTEDEDADTIEGMRHLADYHGICHIRTPEGSSYACDIQVTENNAYSDGIIVSYVLTATRVDPEGLDGMTYEEYINDLE